MDCLVMQSYWGVAGLAEIIDHGWREQVETLQQVGVQKKEMKMSRGTKTIDTSLYLVR